MMNLKLIETLEIPPGADDVWYEDGWDERVEALREQCKAGAILRITMRDGRTILAGSCNSNLGCCDCCSEGSWMTAVAKVEMFKETP